MSHPFYPAYGELLGLDLDVALSDTAALFAFEDRHDAAVSSAVEGAGIALDRADSLRLHAISVAAVKTQKHANRAHSATGRVLRGAA